MSRHRIKRSTFWGPALYVMGATAARSYVDIEPDKVIAQFGWKRIEIPRADIDSAEVAQWPWWGGIGWRSDLRHSVGLIGALGPILLIRVKPQSLRFLGIPIRLTKLYLSVDDPDQIVSELSQSI